MFPTAEAYSRLRESLLNLRNRFVPLTIALGRVRTTGQWGVPVPDLLARIC